MAEIIIPVDPSLEDTINNDPNLLNALANTTSQDAFMSIASAHATEIGLPFKHDQVATAISEDRLLDPFDDMDQMMSEKDYDQASGISDIEASMTDSNTVCWGHTCGYCTDSRYNKECEPENKTTKIASCTCGLFCW